MKILNKIKELFRINNQRGVVLPIILMAIGGLSLIGAAAIGVSTGEIGIANNDRNYKAALNMAEAGVSDAADGIQANRDLLPRPLGAVNSASYSFNVALGNTGRYSVTVSLPVVTTLDANVAVNASSVVVANTAGLNAGDIVVIGNTTTHIMTRIGSIDQGTRTLYLMDNKGNPYVFGQTLASGSWVSKNKLQITSTGYAGLGLVGQYTTVGGWRTLSAVNAAPNPTLSTAGALRSFVTLQGEYSMQEIAVFGSFQAKVNNPGSKFIGPIFVTDKLEVNPYNRGDYSGPIFAPYTQVTGGNIKFNNTSYDPITGTPNANYPKVIGVSAAASTKANLQGALDQAAASSTCYQTKCGQASASQQIYYLNGYQVDVKVFKPQKNGNGLSLVIGDDVAVDANDNLTFSFVITQDLNLGSTDNVTVVWDLSGPPTNTSKTLTVASSPVTTNAGAGDTGDVTLSGSNLKFSGGTYSAGTIITVTVEPGTGANALPTSGAYVWLYDNSANFPGFSGGTAYSNGVWMTPLGNIESQVKEGDVNWLTDAGAGSHTDPTTSHNHSAILTNDPDTKYRGLYATSDTASSTATGWTNGDGALLFGGRNKNSTAWVVGDMASYYTTYYIHTNAVGSCNDHDITITSYTKVTYLGISTKCGDNDTKKLFLYETIWNHTSINTLNKGLQPDDTDSKLGYVPHKGYFKWVRATDSNENKLFKGVEVLLGDKEFLSVFNHSANTNGDFHSAVINANIEKIRMIGWSNPPLAFNNSLNRMDPSALSFASAPVWMMPVNASGTTSWDWPDMIGTRSQFSTTLNSRGFDFSNFSTVLNSINSTTGYIEAYQTSPGTYKLPDMSIINNRTSTTNNTGTGTINLYSTNTNPTTTWPGTWSSNGTITMPGNPLMDPNQLKTTVITATISGPYFTNFEIKRGSANLFFDAANGIPFNIKELKIETKGAGASITMGTPANPATVFANEFKLESEDCGGTINFSFTGKMVAKEVEFEDNVKYSMDTTLSGANTCLSPALQSFIYLKKEGWKEVR